MTLCVDYRCSGSLFAFKGSPARYGFTVSHVIVIVVFINIIIYVFPSCSVVRRLVLESEYKMCAKLLASRFADGPAACA